jgi:ATP-binding cassette subfamily C (CFTR/MRP) protein 1
VLNGEIDAPTLFTVVVTFEKLRMPLLMFPQSIAGLADARVGAKRVATFLGLAEVEDKPQPGGGGGDDDGVAIKVEQGEFFWDSPSEEQEQARTATAVTAAVTKTKNKKKSRNKAKEERLVSSTAESSVVNPSFKNVMPVLQDINCSLRRGSLTAVVGPVGSGKSSFCNAILGELTQTKGSVQVNGSIAYVAQTPWILHASVRDNILFGEDFDDARYRRVVEVCQLTHDLDLLEAGDMTMIGERGINLSGGVSVVCAIKFRIWWVLYIYIYICVINLKIN